MRKKRIFEIGSEYHIYARGTDKRNTFLSENDYIRFMALIYVCNQKEKINLNKISLKNFNLLRQEYPEPLVRIKQFCLMPNHFHLVCEEIINGGISKYMQKILSGYTVYFNKKYAREGALFSSTYKAKLINNDLYVEYIKKYIYFNPLKLIKNEYDSKDVLLYEKEKVTSEELEFLRDYPYKF
jgi:putative transposase